MTDIGNESLFFELFGDLPRQGPGDDASTLRARKYSESSGYEFVVIRRR